MTRLLRFAVVVVLLAGCKPKPNGPPPSPTAMPAPRPLERLAPETWGDAGADDREALFEVKPFTPHGKAFPAGAVKLELLGDAVAQRTDAGRRVTTLDAESASKVVAGLDHRPVLLVPEEGTYLAQVTPLLAALDDVKAEVWLQHPDAPLAFKLTLQDEPAYQAWLDEPGPGRVRVIQRADGYELTTGLGKLLGLDPNGPTVPVRGGRPDLATLQKGLDRVKARFKEAQEVYFVPSYGTELSALARTVSTNWLSDDQVIFSESRWVYPRPRLELEHRDAGR